MPVYIISSGVATTTGVVASANPASLFVSVNLTATVTPTSGPAVSSGTVQFKENGVNIGSPVAVSAGTAILAHTFTTAPDVGVQSITAVYSGGGSWAGSTSPGYSLTINKAATTTLLTSSEAPSFFEDEVTYSVTVGSSGGPGPTGNVDLADSIVTPGFPYTLPLTAGAASIILNNLNPGIHTLTATYQGDTLYATSNHVLIQQVVDLVEPQAILPGFSLIGTFSAQGDAALTPTASLLVIPASAAASTSLTLLWNVSNVPKIRITGTNGLDTGVLVTGGSGAFIIGNGVLVTTAFTLQALDAGGNPVLVNGNPLTATAIATVV